MDPCELDMSGVSTDESTNNFNESVMLSKCLNSRPENNELLRMYGMFKYVNVGNATGDPPSILWNTTSNYKWHEWKKHDNKSVISVQREYTVYVNMLIEKYGMTIPETTDV